MENCCLKGSKTDRKDAEADKRGHPGFRMKKRGRRGKKAEGRQRGKRPWRKKGPGSTICRKGKRTRQKGGGRGKGRGERATSG